MDSRDKSKSSRTDRSLCEKSMRVVSNIIRISSFSLAQRTLGGTTVRASSKEEEEEEDTVSEIEPLVVLPGGRSRGSSGRRLQEPQIRQNRTYVIKPAAGGGGGGNQQDEISHHRVIQHEIEKKEECVDGLASDYIKKIRNQIGCGL